MSAIWPAFSYMQWRETCDTLHAHTQVLGKLSVALAPPEPELQHAALRLTARGWETAPLPAPDAPPRRRACRPPGPAPRPPPRPAPPAAGVQDGGAAHPPPFEDRVPQK